MKSLNHRSSSERVQNNAREKPFHGSHDRRGDERKRQWKNWEKIQNCTEHGVDINHKNVFFSSSFIEANTQEEEGETPKIECICHTDEMFSYASSNIAAYGDAKDATRRTDATLASSFLAELTSNRHLPHSKCHDGSSATTLFFIHLRSVVFILKLKSSETANKKLK